MWYFGPQLWCDWQSWHRFSGILWYYLEQGRQAEFTSTETSARNTWALHSIAGLIQTIFPFSTGILNLCCQGNIHSVYSFVLNSLLQRLWKLLHLLSENMMAWKLLLSTSKIFKWRRFQLCRWQAQLACSNDCSRSGLSNWFILKLEDGFKSQEEHWYPGKESGIHAEDYLARNVNRVKVKVRALLGSFGNQARTLLPLPVCSIPTCAKTSFNT